jgi:2-polyprenyl-3-methyl-5-hydroxy-6-metoxy-1,4-benzoquinol methylase
MDDPGLDPAAHRQALAGLARLDRAARAERLIWPVLRRLGEASGERLAVLDLACGGGEPAVPLLKRARRAGLPLSLTACDLSPVALEAAAERATTAGLAVTREPQAAEPRAPSSRPEQELILRQADVLASPPAERYDVVMCSLFLHHLADDQAIRLLVSMRERALRAVLVQDLRRSRRGWFLARLASRLLTRSEVVRYDALRSVEGAFTAAELGFLAGRAGLNSLHTRVDVRWPERLLLAWERP